MIPIKRGKEKKLSNNITTSPLWMNINDSDEGSPVKRFLAYAKVFI